MLGSDCQLKLYGNAVGSLYQVQGWTYDLNGQLRNDGIHSYTYDALGRMVLADSISYGYTDDGVLTSRTAGDQTSTYAQDIGGGLSQRLFAQTGGTRTTYYHGLTPLAEQTGTGPRAWYLRDQLGSVRQTYDDSGALLASPTVRYDPFGAVRWLPSLSLHSCSSLLH